MWLVLLHFYCHGAILINLVMYINNVSGTFYYIAIFYNESNF